MLSVKWHTALCCATRLSVTHVFLDVDVIHAFAVELLLHAGDGSVVSGHSVDSCVVQTSLLHHITAHLHDQRNKLHDTQQEDVRYDKSLIMLNMYIEQKPTNCSDEHRCDVHASTVCVSNGQPK